MDSHSFFLWGYVVWIIPCFIVDTLSDLFFHERLIVRDLMRSSLVSFVPVINVMNIPVTCALTIRDCLDKKGTFMDKEGTFMDKKGTFMDKEGTFSEGNGNRDSSSFTPDWK